MWWGCIPSMWILEVSLTPFAWLVGLALHLCAYYSVVLSKINRCQHSLRYYASEANGGMVPINHTTASNTLERHLSNQCTSNIPTTNAMQPMCLHCIPCITVNENNLFGSITERAHKNISPNKCVLVTRGWTLRMPCLFIIMHQSCNRQTPD